MNAFKNIRFVLFGLMVIGCFANFAQNEYGLTILYWTEFLVGMTFMIEAFAFSLKNKGWRKAFLFLENLSLGVLMIALALSGKPSALPRLMMAFALLFLFVIYLSYGIRALVTQSRKGLLISLFVFILMVSVLLATIGLSFKVQHWPFANLMMRTGTIIGFCILLLSIFRIKLNETGEKITIGQKINKLPGKIKLTFLYFTIWSAYITFAMAGFAPNFYALSVPPAVVKLDQTDKSRAVLYWQHYDNFFENRRRAGEN